MGKRVETHTRMTVGELDDKAKVKTLGGAELISEEVVRSAPEREEKEESR